MKIGDKIRKPKGYAFDGTIRSVFENSKGETRIVAELDGNGMLHIFSPSQLELREGSYGFHKEFYTYIGLPNIEELWREYNREVLSK